MWIGKFFKIEKNMVNPYRIYDFVYKKFVLLNMNF